MGGTYCRIQNRKKVLPYMTKNALLPWHTSLILRKESQRLRRSEDMKPAHVLGTAPYMACVFSAPHIMDGKADFLHVRDSRNHSLIKPTPSFWAIEKGCLPMPLRNNSFPRSKSLHYMIMQRHLAAFHEVYFSLLHSGQSSCIFVPNELRAPGYPVWSILRVPWSMLQFHTTSGPVLP
jgi:hypothetical protein